MAQQEAEHQDPTAKAPCTCADSEKCWELGVAGVCDMPYCYLGAKGLVPLPPKDWSFPWVSYLECSQCVILQRGREEGCSSSALVQL